MASTHQHDVDLLEELIGVGTASAGAPPMLDLEGPGHGVVAMPSDIPEDADDDAGVTAELEQMKMHAEAAQEASRKAEREALLDRLQTRGQSAAEERQALAGYMEELRARDDETGDAIRGTEFTKEVDQRIAQEQKLARVTQGGGDDANAGTVAHIIQHVKDPATFEALLEVQRLDEALAEGEKNHSRGSAQAEASSPTPRGGGAAAAHGKPHKAANGKQHANGTSARPSSQPRGKQQQQNTPPLPLQSQSQPQSRQAARKPLLLSSQPGSATSSLHSTPRSNGIFLTSHDGLLAPSSSASDVGVEEGTGTADAVSALAAEIEKLKGIDGAGSNSRASSASRRAPPSAQQGGSEAEDNANASAEAGSKGLVVGGRRRVAGMWISVEDEARIDALLGEDAALSELERLVVDADDERLLLLECPAGVGYQPSTQDSARLEEIEGALSELRQGDDGLSDDLLCQLRQLPSPPSLAATGAAGGGAAAAAAINSNSQRFENYLDENKAMREDKAVLDRVRDRLSQLQHIPSDAPATGPVEQQQLADLLATVRKAAEQRLEAGIVSTMATPRTGGSSASRPSTASTSRPASASQPASALRPGMEADVTAAGGSRPGTASSAANID